MRAFFRPRPVNQPFGDPLLFVDLFERQRALLFDLGETGALSARAILRLSEVFVSHAHLDHFSGFDRLLRVLVGRQRTLRLYGPAGFDTHVEHRLAGYAWNLVDERTRPSELSEAERAAAPADPELVFEVVAFAGGTALAAARFRSRNGFRREELPLPALPPGVLLDDAELSVHAVELDHHLPVLAFALREKQALGVDKARLQALGLRSGPWLRALKAAWRRGAPAGEVVEVPLEFERSAVSVQRSASAGTGLHGQGQPSPRTWTFGELAGCLRPSAGECVGYVVDCVDSALTRARLRELFPSLGALYIEAHFLDADRDRAARHRHLTARQAGEIARFLGAREVHGLHYSPRYEGHGEALERELEQAFRGG